MMIITDVISDQYKHVWLEDQPVSTDLPQRVDYCYLLGKMKLSRTLHVDSARCVQGICVGISYRDGIKSTVLSGHPDGSLYITCEEARFDLLFREVEELLGRSTYIAPDGHKDESQGFGMNDAAVYPPKVDDELGEYSEGDSAYSSADEEEPWFRPPAFTDLVTTVQLESHWNTYEIRPRIRVKFLNQNIPETYSLMFDTGSDLTFMRMASMGCPAWYGYVDAKGVARDSPRSLSFGTDDFKHGLDVTRTVDELLEIEGNSENLHVDDTIGLFKTCDEAMDTGLLGAGRGSAFSRAAGVFAYLPALDHAGTLLVGRNHEWSSFCAEGYALTPFDLIDNDSAKHAWVVKGSSWLTAPDGQIIVGVENDWIFDTGASGLYVPESIASAIREAIIEADSSISGDRMPHEFDFIEDCDRTRQFLPTIKLVVGESEFETVTVRLRPIDYTGPIDPRTGQCQLRLSTSRIDHMGRGNLFGIRPLSNFLTLFNEIEGSLAMCTAKF
jgi:hypothetical protein